MLRPSKGEKSVLTEHESNVLEVRDGLADKFFKSSPEDTPEERVRKHPFGNILFGLFVVWLGYHWMAQFTTYLKSGAMGAGGVILFVAYPVLASVIFAGLMVAFKGLKALFTP